MPETETQTSIQTCDVTIPQPDQLSADGRLPPEQWEGYDLDILNAILESGS